MPTPPSIKPRFAIVCDSACDLPLEAFADSGIVMAPLHVVLGEQDLRDCLDMTPEDFYVAYSSTHGQVAAYSPTRSDYELAYEGLIEQGWKEIVSLHVSSALRDAYALAISAARSISGARISVIDSKCVSAQLGLVLAALVRDRAAGRTADEAVEHATKVAEAARMFVLPAMNAHPSRQGQTKSRGGILSRAESLRARALGVRRIFTINKEGYAEETYRSTELSRLAASCAREMSAYSAEVGPLTYVEVIAGAPGILPIFEKPLDTNEFESERAATVLANPSTTAQLGVGALLLAYVPASLVTPDDFRALLPDKEKLQAVRTIGA